MNATQKKLKITMTDNSPMYIYATEMLSSYYSKLSLKDKNILTISGSGDQIFDAYFFGAKEVHSFDLNKKSLFISNLKWAAIDIFTYAEFLQFFGTNYGDASFDYKLYKKIRLSLDKKTCTFFDSLYKKNQNSGIKIAKSEEYFRQRGEILFRPIKEVNAYLKNEKNYLLLRDIIKGKKINFISSDIISIVQKLGKNKKFDIINISNVINYLNSSMDKTDREQYLIDLLIDFKKMLTKKGRIFFYVYTIFSYPERAKRGLPPSSRKSFIANLRKLTKMHYLLENKKFPGIHKLGPDKIIVLTKK